MSRMSAALLSFALSAAALAQPAVNPQAICPISDEDLVTALSTFAEMTTVFLDRRCSNCHGAVNPYAEGGGHVGSKIGLEGKLRTWGSDRGALVKAMTDGAGRAPTDAQVREAQTVIKTYFSADSALSAGTTAELLDHGHLNDAIGAICTECHEHQPVRWRIAMSQFAGKTQGQLCEMFQSKMDASNFLGHVTADSDRFVQVGFAGTRALTTFGKQILKEVTGRDYMVEPVRAMSPNAFITASNKWVRALGSRFHKPPSCGCEPVKYVMKVKIDADVTVAGPAGVGQAKSRQSFEAPMRFIEEGKFTAAGRVPVVQTLDIAGGGGPRGGNCKFEQSHDEDWSVTGTVDEKASQIKLAVKVQVTNQNGALVCVMGGKTHRQPIPPRLSQTEVRQHQMTASAIVGQTTTQTVPMQGGKLDIAFSVAVAP